jgi:hypothetical protein
VPPWLRPYDEHNDSWGYDPDEYEYACDQWSLDSSNFLNGLDRSEIDETGMTGDEKTVVDWYYNRENSWLFIEYASEEDTVEKHETDHDNWVACEYNDSLYSASYPALLAQYEGAALQYTADSTTWVADSSDYVQVFNQDTAQSNAQKALNGWLNLCTPPIHSCNSSHPCCLHVVMDNTEFDFRNGPTTILAQTTTPGSINVVPCKDSLCPKAIIEVNVTDGFLSSNSQPGSDTGVSTSLYTLHQVSRTEFYTGQTPPDTVASGYSAYSFFQLMEHEIGHYLGLNHPDDTADGGHMCRNCYTTNPFYNTVTGKMHTSGFRTVMAENNNVPNRGSGLNSPLPLTNEDDCQFEKLYCNACGGGMGVAPCAYVDGVAIPQQDNFNAQLYPNPTTGECTLVYQVTGQSFVQVAVYDMLGTPVLAVSSDYESEGQHTISLGTESLPSGNYVCRVRVGADVSYINLIVRK